MATKVLKNIVAHCPRRGPGRVAEVVALHVKSGEDPSGAFDWKNEYRTIRCSGCGNIQFQVASTDSTNFDQDYGPDGEVITTYDETITYWPPLSRRTNPEWLMRLAQLDHRLGELLAETYQALTSELNVLAAIGMRTVFDRATEVLKIDPALPFGEKLDRLLNEGEIGDKDYHVLALLTDAGSAAAHRGWKPTATQLNTMVLILESFLYRVFILAQEAKTLAKRIPRRRRRAKAKRPK